MNLISIGAALVLSVCGVSSAGAQAAFEPPRLPSGRPDLQGVWDFRTLTPLQRPEDQAGKAVLTSEEAAEVEGKATARSVELNTQSEVRTELLPVGGNVGGYNHYWVDQGAQMSARVAKLVKDGAVKKAVKVANLGLKVEASERTIDSIFNITSKFEIAIENSINGIILTNTSSANRGNLNDIQKGESGGLSGKPIEAISNRLISKFYKFLDKKVPIIGVGGVDSGKSAYKKILAGASLVQLYTGMIYKGPEIVKNIKKEFIKQLKNDGVKNFTEIIGQDTSSKF